MIDAYSEYMDQFQSLYAPPPDLAARILQRVARIRFRKMVMTFWLRMSVGAVAIAALPDALAFLEAENAQTGFTQIVETVAVHAGNAREVWQDIIWSLIETVPTTSTAIALFVILVMITSLFSSIRMLPAVTRRSYAA